MAKQNYLSALSNWVLFIAGLLCLIYGIRYLGSSSADLAAIGLVAGLLLIFGSTIDRFESIKGLGLEAKTKKFDEKIFQAESYLRTLRELTEVTSTSLIKLNTQIGRWDSATFPADMYELILQVKRSMLEMGSDQEAVTTALRPWAKMTCFDAASYFTENLIEILNTKIRELNEQLANLEKPIPAGSEEHKSILDLRGTISGYLKNELGKLHQIELQEYPDKLISIVSSAPGLSSTEKESVLAPIKSFTDEFVYLRDNLDLKTPRRWFELLNHEP